MNKTDFNGFQNSFDTYCEWCERQDTDNKVSWGEWWDSLAAGKEFN